MKPPQFEYFDPTTIDEAVSLLREREGEAKVLAGGQSLVPLLNMRLARPEALVDLRRIEGLDYIREENGALAIGAMTTQRTVERSDVVRERLPLLQAATRLIAHPQIRNRGTVGGSLAHADPAAEYPALALALDAEVLAVGPNGERTIKASELFLGYLATALEPAEVLTEVRFPKPPADSGWSVMEVARRHGDFALAGVVTALSLNGGSISDARIALFGVASAPLRAREAEGLLAGEKPGEALFAEAGRHAAAGIEEPLSDIHASAEFRRHLAATLVKRALAEAAERAGAR
ncbi:MAG: xanthine dehydrogenase family protein subunit M [Dehalococcoidia bacterium]